MKFDATEWARRYFEGSDFRSPHELAQRAYDAGVRESGAARDAEVAALKQWVRDATLLLGNSAPRPILIGHALRGWHGANDALASQANRFLAPDAASPRGTGT